MLYKSDWQLEQIRQYRARKGHEPHFVSDWDCDPADLNILNQIVLPALIPSKENLLKYSYAEDQTAHRETLAYCLHNIGATQIHVDNISIAQNATNALFLCLTALYSRGVSRFLVVTPVYYSVVETLTSLDATVIFFHLRDSDGFEFEFDRIEDWIVSATANHLGRTAGSEMMGGCEAKLQ